MIYAIERDAEGYVLCTWKGNGERCVTVPRGMVQVCAAGYARAMVRMRLERKKRARDR